MTDTATTVKKIRTPRTFDSILKGAMELPLADRVALAKELNRANEETVSHLQKQAQAASDLLKS